MAQLSQSDDNADMMKGLPERGYSYINISVSMSYKGWKEPQKCEVRWWRDLWVLPVVMVLIFATFIASRVDFQPDVDWKP